MPLRATWPHPLIYPRLKVSKLPKPLGKKGRLDLRKLPALPVPEGCRTARNPTGRSTPENFEGSSREDRDADAPHPETEEASPVDREARRKSHWPTKALWDEISSYEPEPPPPRRRGVLATDEPTDQDPAELEPRESYDDLKDPDYGYDESADEDDE